MSGIWPKALAGHRRSSGAPTPCADCRRTTTARFGLLALCDTCSRLRALDVLNNYTVTRERTPMRYAVTADGLLVEEPLAWRQAGDEIGKLVTSGRAKTLVEAVRIARDELPEEARLYEGDVGRSFLPPLAPGGEVEGPRNQPIPVPDALLAKKIADYRRRYPEVGTATTPREFFELFLKGLTREDPAHVRDNYVNARTTDPELRSLYARS
jgi:hypothetical protein